MIGEISGASNEQAQGIEQINRAVSDMDEVVQNNANRAQESVNSAQELNNYAKRMKTNLFELMTAFGESIKQVKRQPGKPVRSAPKKRQAKAPAKRQKPKEAVQRTAQTDRLKSTKEVSPEQLIPFDDDDFKDF